MTLESSVDFEDYIRREIRVSSSNVNTKFNDTFDITIIIDSSLFN